MGLKDRLLAAKHHLWSPITISMFERGSDTVVRAGQTAKVVVEVTGEPDPTAERVEIRLEMNYSMLSWPLGEVPVTLGRHELEVQMPVDGPPSTWCTKYLFRGKLIRSKGTEHDVISPVLYIADPAHVYVPEGPASEGSVSLDRDRVNLGEPISGRAPGADKVEVGTYLDQLVGYEGGSKQKQTFKVVGECVPDASGAFSVVIPSDAPPTVWDGHQCWLTWEVRVKDGWARFAVLDPEGTTHIPVEKASIAQYLG